MAEMDTPSGSLTPEEAASYKAFLASRFTGPSGSLIEAIANVLSRHRLEGHYTFSLCGCERRFSEPEATDRFAAYEKHVAEYVADAVGLEGHHRLPEEVRLAAEAVDWQTVVFNGGPPCFALEPLDQGHFCTRAQRWDGHRPGGMHAFVSLAALLARVAGTAPRTPAPSPETGPV
jgi:hypothetical protein